MWVQAPVDLFSLKRNGGNVEGADGVASGEGVGIIEVF